MLRWLATAAVAVGLFSGALALQAKAEEKPIIFGLSVAMTGPWLAYDGDGTRMAQVFIDDVNAKGGILGRKVQPIFADTKGDRAEGAKAGQKVVSEGADLVFVTCDYDFGAPAALQAQKAGKISVFLCAEDPKAGIVGVGPYSFSASAAAQVQGATIAEWGYQKRNMRTAFVLLDDFIEYNKSVCAGFDWMFPKLGGKIVDRDTFKNADSSIATQITHIRNAMSAGKLDAVMLCTITPGGSSAIRQMRAAGIDVPILNGSGMDGTYWLNSVPNLSNFYEVAQASVYGDDPRPEVRALIERYKAKFNEGPVTQYAFPIYAFLQLWQKAVEKAGTLDAAKVVAVMNTFKDEPTILGPRSFSDKLHDQDRANYFIIEINDGKGKVLPDYGAGGSQEFGWRISEAVPNDVLYRLKK
jgi:branched-chain amino acid transport system substrate-binding protein